MTISYRNMRVNQSNFSPPFTYLACMAGSDVSPAEAIIRLLVGDVCDWAGPFLKFEKKPSHGLQEIEVRFPFGFSLKPRFSVSV